MNFEQWCLSQGFNSTEIDAGQLAAVRGLYAGICEGAVIDPLTIRGRIDSVLEVHRVPDPGLANVEAERKKMERLETDIRSLAADAFPNDPDRATKDADDILRGIYLGHGVAWPGDAAAMQIENEVNIVATDVDDAKTNEVAARGVAAEA